MVTKRVPFGLQLLAIFFGFGALMCALTIVLLLFPGTELDVAWRLNREAQRSFQSLGTLSILLMAAVVVVVEQRLSACSAGHGGGGC